MKRFAVFILSHGRAKEIQTVEMLKRQNYTGDWFVVIDNEDDQEPIYREKFGDHIIQFDKKKEAETTDTGDLDDDRRVGVFARNAIQRIAKEMGYKYHLQLDDDFSGIIYKRAEGPEQKLKRVRIDDLDRLFSAMCDYMDSTNINWLSFALSSDFLGGATNNKYKQGLFPKTMGSFFMRTERHVKFVCRMNDDVTTCALNWSRGIVSYTLSKVLADTPETQNMSGGMTDIYKENGTYRKSFYSVMMCPSFASIARQGITHYRIHHQFNWGNCVPRLLNQKWRKT